MYNDRRRNHSNDFPAVTKQPLANERQLAILMAALECFNEKGIEATSIQEIGKRAGASVGSMYHHFSNKEGIAIALLVEGLRRNTEQLEQQLSKARSARQGIKACVLSVIDWLSENSDWARFIYTISSTRLMSGEHPGLTQVNANHARVIDGFFRPHIEAGAFRKFPAECLPSLILGPVHDYARRWLNGQVAIDIKSHEKLFADVAWHTVKKS